MVGLDEAHPPHVRGQVKAMVASFQHLRAVLKQTQIGEDEFIAKHFFRHVLVALPIRADDVVAFFFEAFREVRGCSFREGGGEIGQRTRSGVDGFLFFETKALARYYNNHLPAFLYG